MSNSMLCVLDVPVGLYSSYRDVAGRNTVSLAVWLSDVTYKEQVEKIRAEKDVSKRREMKSKLPCVTPSGLFDGRRSEGLFYHSGLVCIDIDGKDNQHIGNFHDLKTQISRIKNVAYCGLSVSGEGYFVIVPIEYPDKHEQQYKALLNLFESFGIIADPQCGNLNRTRTRSYDPDAYWNWDATGFKGLVEEGLEPASQIGQNLTMVEDSVRKKVQKIVSEEIDITGRQDDWFKIACALANTFGEGGLQYFLDVSQFYTSKQGRYSEKEATKLYNYCLRRKYGKITIGTFYHYCKMYEI